MQHRLFSKALLPGRSRKHDRAWFRDWADCYLNGDSSWLLIFTGVIQINWSLGGEVECRRASRTAPCLCRTILNAFVTTKLYLPGTLYVVRVRAEPAEALIEHSNFFHCQTAIGTKHEMIFYTVLWNINQLWWTFITSADFNFIFFFSTTQTGESLVDCISEKQSRPVRVPEAAELRNSLREKYSTRSVRYREICWD